MAVLVAQSLPQGWNPEHERRTPSRSYAFIYLFIRTEVTKASGQVLIAQIFVLATLSGRSVEEVTLN